MNVDWRPFVKLVSAHSSFLLTCHLRADCDAIGSELALADALRTLGKEVQVVNGDPVPPHISFLNPAGEVTVLGSDVSIDSLPPFEVAIVLDTSAWSQLGPMGDVIRKAKSCRIVIDHHASSDDLDAEPFKDTSVEATGRLVLAAVEALGAPITTSMATALFTAIATDTGWFRFASVTEETLTAAAKLVALGAQPGKVFSLLYEQNSLARLKLQGRVLSKVQPELGGRLMIVEVLRKDLADTGAEPTDTEDMVNRLLTVTGVEVAALFQELEANRTKVSLRSRSDLDVRQVAEQFQGGGHKAAAGIKFHGTLPEARAAVLDALRKAMG